VKHKSTSPVLKGGLKFFSFIAPLGLSVIHFGSHACYLILNMLLCWFHTRFQPWFWTVGYGSVILRVTPVYRRHICNQLQKKMERLPCGDTGGKCCLKSHRIYCSPWIKRQTGSGWRSRCQQWLCRWTAHHYSTFQLPTPPRIFLQL